MTLWLDFTFIKVRAAWLHREFNHLLSDSFVMSSTAVCFSYFYRRFILSPFSFPVYLAMSSAVLFITWFCLSSSSFLMYFVPPSMLPSSSLLSTAWFLPPPPSPLIYISISSLTMLFLIYLAISSVALLFFIIYLVISSLPPSYLSFDSFSHRPLLSFISPFLLSPPSFPIFLFSYLINLLSFLFPPSYLIYLLIPPLNVFSSDCSVYPLHPPSPWASPFCNMGNGRTHSRPERRERHAVVTPWKRRCSFVQGVHARVFWALPYTPFPDFPHSYFYFYSYPHSYSYSYLLFFCFFFSSSLLVFLLFLILALFFLRLLLALSLVLPFPVCFLFHLVYSSSASFVFHPPSPDTLPCPPPYSFSPSLFLPPSASSSSSSVALSPPLTLARPLFHTFSLSYDYCSSNYHLLIIIIILLLIWLLWSSPVMLLILSFLWLSWSYF